MCTLIALWRCHPSAPLILALNRDEYVDRPTRAIGLWDDTKPGAPILAGRDLRSGGTWFGIGRNVVAALTNHHSAEPVGPRARSRGDLVVRALTSPSLNPLGDGLRGLSGAEFGLFHLLATDGKSMTWFTNEGGEIEARNVEPGPHVLGNHGLDNEDDPVVRTLHRELRGVEDMKRDELIDHLTGALAGHGPGRPCVHRGEFATRSSAILLWGGADPLLRTTDGPPCEKPWRDRSALLRELAAD